MNFWVVKSDNDANTFFIFRESGTEVKVEIKKNIMVPSHYLMESEKEYFKNNIVRCGHLELNLKNG
ncbi:MAG: hypothetical protein AAF348_11545 [Bacteroidota bacterium]